MMSSKKSLQTPDKIYYRALSPIITGLQIYLNLWQTKTTHQTYFVYVLKGGASFNFKPCYNVNDPMNYLILAVMTIIFIVFQAKFSSNYVFNL